MLKEFYLPQALLRLGEGRIGAEPPQLPTLRLRLPHHHVLPFYLLNHIRLFARIREERLWDVQGREGRKKDDRTFGDSVVRGRQCPPPREYQDALKSP